jgi:hypothetical protein
MPALSDYITIDDVTAFKTVDGEEAKRRATEALEAACDIFETEVGRPLLLDTYSEVLSGDGSDILMTSNWPINAVQYLQVVNTEWQVLDAALGVMGDLNEFQAYIPMHRLWLQARGGSYVSFSEGFGLNPSVRGSVFPDGVGNILITYTAGYLPTTPSSTPVGWYKVLPPKIKTAVVAITHLILNDKGWVGVGSKTVGGNFESIQQIIRKFEEYPWIGGVLDHERRRGT